MSRGQVAALEVRIIDERDLAQALGAFTPVWDELFPRERERILQLLVEEVTYRADGGEVAISFRPGGVRVLAERGDRKSA